MNETDFGYCERLGPEFWAEPVNAVTNAAFLIAAAVMWYRTRGARPGVVAVLCLVLGVIGIGSFLFHTFATPWAALADVLPILGFILVYFYASNRWYWGLGLWSSLALTGLFIPYAMGVGWGVSRLPAFSISAPYWPVFMLISMNGWMLRTRLPKVARGLLIGAGILGLSLVFRSVDRAVCGVFPVGSHFMWHFLNATMLAWMIAVLARHLKGRVPL